jgi:bidirectional [NiFe] hydrogenase diaphorase subunit
MSARTLTMDGRPLSAADGQSLLDVAQENGVVIPRLCHLDGLSEVGACRLCVVEVVGSTKLAPACLTPADEGMVVTTDSPRLRSHRRMIVELLFAERNHVCSVCVANGACELQDLAYAVGMDHVRFPYQHPDLAVDASHPRFSLDNNRCVLCTRCVRICDEIEGAHTWDVARRGAAAQVITDLAQPWGESDTCTGCGKCVHVCPTGALSEKVLSRPERTRQRDLAAYLRLAREKKQWIK